MTTSKTEWVKVKQRQSPKHTLCEHCGRPIAHNVGCRRWDQPNHDDTGIIQHWMHETCHMQLVREQRDRK